jgi:hypothetical protein|nr:hypothetical protein AUSP0033_00041 [uncultured phage]
MKDKIFQSLKQAYSSFGLSDDILQGHADALTATGLVTDDNLATIVAAQKPLFSSLQSGIDKRVTDALNKAKEKKEVTVLGGEESTPLPDLQKLIDDAIAAKVMPLQEKINQYEAGAAKASRESMIFSKARELNISKERIEEGFAITDEMDENAINSYLSRVRQNEVARSLEDKSSAFSLSTPEAQGKELAKQWAETLPDAN